MRSAPLSNWFHAWTRGAKRSRAMRHQTQSKLSVRILGQGGHYVWLAKDNQPSLRQDIICLFTPEVHTPGFSAPPDDFEAASTRAKATGGWRNVP
jgi:hypothetical protein